MFRLNIFPIQNPAEEQTKESAIVDLFYEKLETRDTSSHSQELGRADGTEGNLKLLAKVKCRFYKIIIPIFSNDNLVMSTVGH